MEEYFLIMKDVLFYICKLPLCHVVSTKLNFKHWRCKISALISVGMGSGDKNGTLML